MSMIQLAYESDRVHKMQEIYSLAEKLSASQERA